jgi:hypothetical protein
LSSSATGDTSFASTVQRSGVTSANPPATNNGSHRPARAPVIVIGYLAIDEEIPMDGTVDITIPVEPIAAAELRDARKREAVGKLVSLVLRREREQNGNLLFAAIEKLGAAAEAKGLTDEICNRN